MPSSRVRSRDGSIVGGQGLHPPLPARKWGAMAIASNIQLLAVLGCDLPVAQRVEFRGRFRLRP